jgi:glycerol-1-phosphate dehydrogenase [NAD(P)+]
MTSIDPIYVGEDATARLLRYCDERNLRKLVLISDSNTHRALGGQVERALRDQQVEVTSLVLAGDEVIADAHYVLQVLLRAPLGECTFISIGAGTLTDITRFVSHRTGRSFIAMPTAPSVDGFTSIGAPLVVGGVKITIVCQAPVAMFADLATLCNAPHRLIAAGFGDMIGKITSLADWKLGSLLWDEPFEAAIYQRTQKAIERCLGQAEAVGRREPDGVRGLMEALVESGLCMLDFGNSRPASGAEHHASHYWEMKLLREGRPAILHGAKVGYALWQVARQYARIRALSRQEVLDRLEAASLPDREQEIAAIRRGYGTLADEVISEHGAFLNLTEAGYEQVKRRIVEHWEQIQGIAATVPPPDQIAHYLRQAGAATEAHALGLGAAEVGPGFEFGHYLRNRFTVLKLSRFLGVPLPAALP